MVVVGGLVVVVVVGVEEDWPVLGAVVVDVVVDDVGTTVDVLPVVFGEALFPGCSLAMTTPMAAVAPVARRMAARVSRRSRTVARRRASGVVTFCGCVMGMTH